MKLDVYEMQSAIQAADTAEILRLFDARYPGKDLQQRLAGLAPIIKPARGPWCETCITIGSGKYEGNYYWADSYWFSDRGFCWVQEVRQGWRPAVEFIIYK